MWGESVLTLAIASVIAALGIFAFYCASAGAQLIELERTEEDRDRLVSADTEDSRQREMLGG
jgi:hypothetical protein